MSSFMVLEKVRTFHDENVFFSSHFAEHTKSVRDGGSNIALFFMGMHMHIHDTCVYRPHAYMFQVST